METLALVVGCLALLTLLIAIPVQYQRKKKQSFSEVKVVAPALVFIFSVGLPALYLPTVKGDLADDFSSFAPPIIFGLWFWSDYRRLYHEVKELRAAQTNQP